MKRLALTIAAITALATSPAFALGGVCPVNNPHAYVARPDLCHSGVSTAMSVPTGRSVPTSTHALERPVRLASGVSPQQAMHYAMPLLRQMQHHQPQYSRTPVQCVVRRHRRICRPVYTHYYASPGYAVRGPIYDDGPGEERYLGGNVSRGMRTESGHSSGYRREGYGRQRVRVDVRREYVPPTYRKGTEADVVRAREIYGD